jgi:hypothetical protein
VCLRKNRENPELGAREDAGGQSLGAGAADGEEELSLPVSRVQC